MWRHLFAVFAAVAAPFPLVAEEPETFKARVISVSDGDTMRVRRTDTLQHYRIRLFGIDSPESDQPFGDKTRNALWELVKDRDVLLKTTGAITYGRHVARVFVDADVYVNEALMDDGWAWHYKPYTKGQPEAKRFAAAEHDAKEEKLGLWADPNPIRPDCWRKGDRDGDCISDLSPKPFAPFGTPLLPFGAKKDGFDAPVDGPAKLALRFKSLAAKASTDGHLIFGTPTPRDGRFTFRPPGFDKDVPGITLLKRIAFTVGHFDKYRLPARVAMRWTTPDYERGLGVTLKRPSPSIDTDLPAYARGGTSFDFQHTQLERGHMARDDDMEAFGKDAVAQAMKMSNMVPQRKGKNHVVWGTLENLHRDIVGDEDDDDEIDRIWIVAGPIFYPGRSIQRVGTPGTAVPHATYKVIAWFSREGQFLVRGYVIDQQATSADLPTYLRPIDDIEQLTGLDFFSELSDDIEDAVESPQPETVWEG